MLFLKFIKNQEKSNKNLEESIRLINEKLLKIETQQILVSESLQDLKTSVKILENKK